MSTPKVIQCRQARAGDRLAIAALLHDLDYKYPGGLAWFDRRFDDALLGRAYAVIASSNENVLGVAITTPKGEGREKLSTIKVEDQFRKMGIGAEIMSNLKQRWQQENIDQVWVTVDASDTATEQYLTDQSGFVRDVIREDRYGELRNECVLKWSPDLAHVSDPRACDLA